MTRTPPPSSFNRLVNPARTAVLPSSLLPLLHLGETSKRALLARFALPPHSSFQFLGQANKHTRAPFSSFCRVGKRALLARFAHPPPYPSFSLVEPASVRFSHASPTLLPTPPSPWMNQQACATPTLLHPLIALNKHGY